jgi:hypothetical protein
MMVSMSKRSSWVALAFVLTSCALDVPEPGTSSTEQAGINMQGINMQGINMQGINMQGINMQGMKLLGFDIAGATLGSAPLSDVHVDKGELVAYLGAVEKRGTDLIGAQLIAEARDITQNPPVTVEVTFRIADIEAESSSYDPTGTGHTYLYTLEQWVWDTESWETACPADYDNKHVAIPLGGAVFDEHGDRVASSTMFTFGCTSGVIAKCYRWGYRPWVTGYGDLVSMHWTCTRLARADYCGDGTSHTHDGTLVNVWDRLPPPGPIQTRGGLLPPLGMLFEAGWNTGGAVCLSHARWLLDDGIANWCPERLVAPGLLGLGGTVCDTLAQVLGYDPDAKLFDDSYLNL